MGLKSLLISAAVRRVQTVRAKTVIRIVVRIIILLLPLLLTQDTLH